MIMQPQQPPEGGVKPPHCCFSKPVRTWCGVVALIIGIIILAIGASIPGVVTRIAVRALTDVLPVGTSLDVPVISARITADIFGGPAGTMPVGITTGAGTSSDDEDNGLANDYYVPDITNVAAILAGGNSPPAPVVREIGPLAYRTYSTIQQDCATCGVSGGVQTWYDRKWVRYDSANAAAGFKNHNLGGPFDTTYVTVPNTNYRGLEALLAGVTNGAISSFESLAVPLLGLQGVAQLTAPGALDLGLRVLTFPLMVNAMVNDAVTHSLTAADFVASGSQAEQFGFAASLGGGSVWATYTASLAAAPPMPTAVPQALFFPSSSSLPQLAASPLTPAGWRLTQNATTDCPAFLAGTGPGTACQAYISAFVAAANDVAANTYVMSVPASAQLAQRDVGVVLNYFGAMLSVSSPPSDAQTRSQYYALNALQGLQSTITGVAPTITTWSDALWAQMANNQVTGLIMAAGVIAGAGGGAAGVAAAQSVYPSLVGVGPANLCSASALGQSAFLSLVDSLPVPGNAVPEFSCWNARASALSFGSKLTGAKLKAVFGASSDPAGVPPPGATVATTLLGGGQLSIAGSAVPGTNGIPNTGLFLAGANSMANAIKAQLTSGTAGPFNAEVGVLQAFAALKAAAPAGGAAFTAAATAYDAAVASADVANGGTTCPAVKGNVLLLPLRCFEILDFASWINHIAKDVVFDPTFVKAGPRKFSAATSTFVPLTDPYYVSNNLFNEAPPGGPMRAGPFLRCTLREYLELGCHDNLMDYAQGLLNPLSPPPGDYRHRMAPVGPTTYEGNSNNAAWSAYKAANQPNVRYTGGSSISQVDTIVSYSVNNQQKTEITAFGGPLGNSAVTTNPVTGSYSGTAYAPTLKLAPTGPDAQDYSAAWPSITVWVYQGLRACTLAFYGQVTDPVGAGVKLWRFMLDTGAGSGAEASAAKWAAAIPRMKTDDAATTPACAANIAVLTSGVKVFLAPPYFGGCSATGLAGAPVPGYSMTGAAATRVATDPVAGTVTFVDVEPVTGRAMNAHKRLGAHMLWGGSTAWYNLKTTYGLLYWVDQHNAVTLPTAKRLLDVFAQLRMATGNGLGILVAIGVIIAAIGLYSTVMGCGMPRADGGAGAGGEIGGKTEDGSFSGVNPSVVFRSTAPQQQAGASVV